MVQYKENKDKMAMLSVITADGQSSAWAGLLLFFYIFFFNFYNQ